MPLPFLLAAKSGAVVRMARNVLAEWNRLDPSAKALLKKEAADVRRSLFEVAAALGARLRDSNEEGLSWEEARQLALNPRADFLLAREIPAVALTVQDIDEHELRSRLGDDVAPQLLESALVIAQEDGFLEPSGPGRWKVTEFGDATLAQSDEIALMEAAITEHIQRAGMAARDELAVGVGCLDSREAEFLDALERALVAGTVEWLGPAMYGLPTGQLAAMTPPHDAALGSSTCRKELKTLVVDLTREVSELRLAVADARADNGTSAARPSRGDRERDPSRSRGLAAKAVIAGARRLADGRSGTMDRFSRKSHPHEPEAVYSHLQTMRAQVEVNEREGRGLMNMPQYGEARAALGAMGSTAVPTLIEMLPQEVDKAVARAPNVACEIVEILGKGGDPTVVDLLVSVMDGTRFPKYPGAALGAAALGHLGTVEAC